MQGDLTILDVLIVAVVAVTVCVAIATTPWTHAVENVPGDDTPPLSAPGTPTPVGDAADREAVVGRITRSPSPTGTIARGIGRWDYVDRVDSARSEGML